MAKYTPMLNDKCFFTGTDKEYCECHHIFGGNPGRKKSEQYGLKVFLVVEYHRLEPLGVHKNRDNDLILKRYGQTKFEETYTREFFIEEFGRNYL